MPKIVSLNSNNQVKYPATITDAVIDLNSGKPLSELLNGVDYSKQYLTFTILQEGTVVFLGNSNGVACCSLDGGRTWSEYGGTVTVQAEVGDVILWKAIPLYFEYSGIGSFSTSTASFNLSGNITSMVHGDNFITSGDTLPQSTGYACAYLFSNTNVISAKNLVLPSTTINTMCYYLLFLDCSSLVEAPEVLPATTLVGGCYLLMFKNCVSLEKAPKILGTNLELSCCEDMFLNCGKLNFIEAHFLTTPSTTSNKDWVAGVAPTGTFVKDPAATWSVVGNYAIPTGWVSLNENQNLTVSKDDVILSRTYNNILRANNSYSSPYATSYLYFGQVKPIDITRGSMVRYRVLAFVPGNANYYLDSIVEWYFTTNGIYSSYYIWNNLKSTSYYPFGYHTLYRSNSAAISLSDGSYIGCYYGTSTSYGQSPNTIARTFLVDILRCENCEVSLLDDIRWLTDTANLPANFKLTSTSVAYNTTNFTAVNVSTLVGLQETGDANSDTVGYSIRTNSYSKPMTSALGYGYRLLFTSSDLLGWVPANNSTSSNATALRTPATDPIDPFGEIVYYSGSAAVAAGSRPSATTLWELYTITLGYSFNTTGAALTLTSWKPVYIKCTPLTNGSATLLEYTQDLPTEEDGFIYIYLGVAYSATAVELVINHPVYHFKDGAIRLWNNNLSDVFLVKFTSIGDPITVDKTAELVYQAMLSGKHVFLLLPGLEGSIPHITPLSSAYYNNNTNLYEALYDSIVDGYYGSIYHSGNTLTDYGGHPLEYSDNKVTSISSSSTNTQYPSAKAVYSTTSVLAPKASPALTGTPTAPTAAAGTNNTLIATTAFVNSAITAAALNAFSNVKVGSTTIAADSKTDILELVAGSNITLTPDATNDKVTIAATDTTYSAATTSAAGLMSAADKTKLDGIATGAQVNVVTSVDTTATAGVNLSLTSGKLDVTVTGGSIASGNGSVVTGGTVYAVTSTLAPKASPALTGTPTAPTAAAGTNTTQIATTAFVKNAVDSKTHYIANLLSGTAANYITEPEFKSVKVNGSTTNSASSSNCVLQYDTTNKCLKFIFN